MTAGLSSAGFVAAQTSDVQTSIQNDELATIDAALNLAPTQPLGQLNGIFASAGANLWALISAIYSALDPNGAVGVQLDNLCALTGVVRLSATKTLVLCTVNLNASQSYAPGALTANVTGYPQYTFVNRDPITSGGAGTYSAYFIATTTGPIAVNAGTLTTITTTVAGWNSITNAANGTTGTNVETDTALRLRRAANIVPTGGSTSDSLRTSVLAVPGVISATVVENTDIAPNAAGQPPKSFQVYVWDGAAMGASNNAIAQAIWNAKGSGIQAYGTSSGVAVDSTGTQRTVYFTRVAQVPLYLTYSLTVDPTLFVTGVTRTLVQQAAVNVASAFVPGSTAYFLAFEAAALTVPGVLDVASLFMGTVPGPSGTTNLTFGQGFIPTLTLTNIAVTP